MIAFVLCTAYKLEVCGLDSTLVNIFTCKNEFSKSSENSKKNLDETGFFIKTKFHIFFSAIDGMDPTVIDTVLNMDLNASSASIGSPALLGSFPVDVVVLIRVEPSVIRYIE